MSEYSALENSQFDKWNQKAEQLFKKHIEMLEYQEKHLINEESLMDELEYLFNLRNKLLKTADETFLA
jgi:hemerythrin